MTQTLPRDEIKAWLRAHAAPLAHVVDANWQDLETLRDILRSVTIVGLAESTHGTREFFQVRHRLLRFLVTEMGFNVLAIEASHSAAQMVNEYIKDGKGYRDAALTGLGFVMWDVVEFAEVLDWLRNYNQTVPDARKVLFYGVDVWNTRVARESVLAYLAVVAPSRVSSIQALFQTIATAEARGMMLAHEHVTRSGYFELQELEAFLTAERDVFIRSTSAAEFERISEHVRVILQWMRTCLTDELDDEWPSGLPKMSTMNNFARSRYMAENLVEMLRRGATDRKVVLWAHVFHLGVGFEDSAHGRVPTMGEYLREQFDDRYYVFGLELGDGEYLARTWLPDNTLGDLKVADIPRAPKGSLPWHLLNLSMGALLLDLRHPPEGAAVAQWLSSPMPTHVISWAHRDSTSLYVSRVIGKVYDGIIFIAQTSATTPTRNALKSAANGTGY
jgi:erythromycin esterase